MPAVPAPIRTWSSRMNVPFGTNNTTTLLLHQFAFWSLKQHLINAHTAEGTLYGTRDSGSVWTVVGSSDGATAGMDGVDRWTTTFTASKMVRAAQGSAHSWVVLQNAASGLQCCIDFNSTSHGQGGIIFARTSGGFTGGNTTTRPSAAANEEWAAASRSAPTTSTSTVNLIPDTTISQAYYSHFSCAADATFHFEISRAGAGITNSFLALWQTTNAQAGDTRNWYAISSWRTSSRGAPSNSDLTTSNQTSCRQYNGTLQANGGPISVTVNTGSSPQNYPGTYSADSISASFIADPMLVREVGTLTYDRGYFADIMFIGTAPVGSTYPSTSPTHMVIGDVLIACGSGATPII